MDLGDRLLSIETGKLALQAHGAVVVRAGDTMCLVTACTSETPRPGIDFFPLTVDYEERLYAAGKIPGSFFRREGRPTEGAILTSRLTDRGLRPLFPEGMRSDVQIIATALSTDQENQIDILCMIGASAALAISGIPFPTLLGSMRVGLSQDDEWVVYPTHSEEDELVLDLVVSSTRDHVMMIEAGSDGVDEETIVEGCAVAQEQCRRVIDLIEELKQKVKITPRPVVYVTSDDEVLDALEKSGARQRFEAALRVEGFEEQKTARRDARKAVAEELLSQFGEAKAEAIERALDACMKKVLRAMILGEKRRPDGRGPREIRPLSAEVGLTPRAHGSGLFTRGQTQVLCIATLGTLGEGQRLDGLTDEEPKTFLHHYNMPPYSTGEAYPMRGPSRRAIGHGALAERALRAVVPDADRFPYSLRLVSEAVSSNGSTSMASVCAGSLAMMDAGVPVSAAVGGMAMGIIYESPAEYCILTDIQGFEDHNGDMDFKVAGTRDGVTALQLDVKAQGLTPQILGQALLQAKEARIQVLDVMDAVISEPRPDLSPFAPRVVTVEIPQDKIGEVIGPGGKTIRKLEEYGVKIEIEEDGRVFVSGVDSKATEQAVQAIKDIVRVPEVGEVFEDATVVRLMPFGAFCEILPGRDGLLHVSDYAWEHTPSISEVLKVGDKVTVKVKEIDDQGRVNLSRKALLARPEGASDDSGGPDRARRPSSSTRSHGRRRPREGDGGEGGEVRYRDKKRS